MKPIIAYAALGAVVGLGLGYLLGAYVLIDFNVWNWSAGVRLTHGGLSPVIGGALGAVAGLFESDIQVETDI